jgi:agmatinase
MPRKSSPKPARSASKSTALPDSRRTPRFAGLTTFGRFPRLQDVAPANLPPDWIIYGVPHDGGVTYRPGARFGPRAIRDASQYLKVYNLELDVNIAESLSITDAGDAPVKPYSTKETTDAVVDFASKLGDTQTTRLFALGGDHSIAYANIRATWQRLGKPKGGLALLHFDAHLDTVDSVWDEKWTHASPFIRAIEDGLIDAKRMLSIGIRGPLNRADDLNFARDRGVRVISADRSRAEAVAEIRAFVQSLKSAQTYLTFDIDVVDPAFAPGTGTPCCGGYSSADLLAMLRACAGANLIGADLVEVLPDRDPAGITAMLAQQIVMEILSVSALAP